MEFDKSKNTETKRKRREGGVKNTGKTAGSTSLSSNVIIGTSN